LELLRKENALRDPTLTGSCSFYVSDSTEGFSKAASLFLNRDVAEHVEYIDIVGFAESHAQQTESD
jgi:glutamate racemase